MRQGMNKLFENRISNPLLFKLSVQVKKMSWRVKCDKNFWFYTMDSKISQYGIKPLNVHWMMNFENP